MTFQDNGALRNYEDYAASLKGLSPSTLKAYRSDICAWLDFLAQKSVEVHQAGRDDARAYVVALSERKRSPATINRSLSSLKGFYQFLEKRKIVEGNPFSGLRSLKKSARLPVYLTNREVEALLEEIEGDGFAPSRDRALFELLYSTGCRVSELCALSLRDIAGAEVLIKGKGGRQRFVFIGPRARKALDAYIPLREEKLKTLGASNHTALILDQRGQALTTRGVYYILQTYMKKSGLNRKVGPHAFRHAFATEILNEGAGIREVQEMLGHASLSTTQVYTHTGIERIRRVYRNAHPHGKKRKDSKTIEYRSHK